VKFRRKNGMAVSASEIDVVPDDPSRERRAEAIEARRRTVAVRRRPKRQDFQIFVVEAPEWTP